MHEKYGWERAALTGMIDTYRIRGAVRDLGQALGLPPDQVGKLAKRVDEREGLPLGEQMRLLPDFQDKVKAPLWQHLIELAGQLYGFPRRLAQHPGGMVIGSSPLTDIVPVQPSAIQGRYVMQWDKDSIEQARFVKIDFLAIGALSQVQDALRAIEARHGTSIDLSRIDFEDPSVYAMLHKADTIGVFQVESAAQQQTIPRIKPENLIDMAHEVAAVRPGVGANDGVRRYIDRRLGLEPVEYVHELERRALERTLGVILFQDQINQIAHDVGGLSHSEADRLRRAFTKRNNGPMIQRWWGRFRDGALAWGVDEETARRIFNRFNGHYMFPESHAFAFGVTAYQISWLKRYYPLEFYLGLFNQQPMGFYTPETLKEDAKRRGVGILSPDVNLSSKLCVIEEESIRLGLSYVKGLGEEAARTIAGAKERAGSFLSLADFMARSGLEQQQVEDLIDAGALDSLCEDRRMARWEVGLRYRPVGRQMELALPVEQDLAPLPKAGAFDEMAREYRTMGLHPASHVMAYIRESLGTRVLTSDEAASVADGERITVAGLVIRRQRPLAKAVFITLEDEHGHIPMVVWPKSYARLRNELKAPFLVVTGVMSRREGTYNLVVEKAKPHVRHPPPARVAEFSLGVRLACDGAEVREAGTGRTLFSNSRRYRDRGIRRGHMQPSANGSQGGVHHVQSRPVLNVQGPVNLRHVPPKASGKLRLADTLLFHTLVQHPPSLRSASAVRHKSRPGTAQECSCEGGCEPLSPPPARGRRGQQPPHDRLRRWSTPGSRGKSPAKSRHHLRGL